MEKKKRIVITGMGVVSCFGNDVDSFYDSLLAGKSGVRELTQLLLQIIQRVSVLLFLNLI